MMNEKTQSFIKESEIARQESVKPQTAVSDKNDSNKGLEIFEQNCAACHAKDEKVVGPPIIEMQTIYSNNQ